VLPAAARRRDTINLALGPPIAERRLVVARRSGAVPNQAGEALEHSLYQAVLAAEGSSPE
jgi:hypothetical protein